MILVLVLVVIPVLTLAAMTYSELMLTEREAAQLTGKQAQARALAESGVDMARLFLSWDRESQDEAGGWYHNPEHFQGVAVIEGDDPRDTGRFTFVAPETGDGAYGGIRYGLEDESTRLNLNTLAVLETWAQAAGVENGGRQILMGLPGMTEEIADAILDYIDSDDDPRDFGAESEHYGSLETPYAPKNGYLDSVEELLLVRDVTPWLLFGADANRNGYADASEPDPDAIPNVDNSDGSMERGWAAYLTVHSLEANLRPDGQPKIDLNQDDLEELYGELEDTFDSHWATFIVAYRQYGPYEEQDPPDPNKKREETPSGDIDLEAEAKARINRVLDLIGVRVQVKYEGEDDTTILEPAFADDPLSMGTYLPQLMDNLTATGQTVIPGRINVNQAPETILAGIPGMDEDILAEILSSRQPDPAAADPERRHETWLLTEGIVTLDQMKNLEPFLTGGGSVFRGQVVGFFDSKGPAARVEVILDATTNPARVIFWRDLGHLGRGYSLETLGTGTPEW